MRHTSNQRAAIAREIQEEEAQKNRQRLRLDEEGNPLPTLAERIKHPGTDGRPSERRAEINRRLKQAGN